MSRPSLPIGHALADNGSVRRVWAQQGSARCPTGTVPGTLLGTLSTRRRAGGLWVLPPAAPRNRRRSADTTSCAAPRRSSAPRRLRPVFGTTDGQGAEAPRQALRAGAGRASRPARSTPLCRSRCLRGAAHSALTVPPRDRQRATRTARSRRLRSRAATTPRFHTGYDSLQVRAHSRRAPGVPVPAPGSALCSSIARLRAFAADPGEATDVLALGRPAREHTCGRCCPSSQSRGARCVCAPDARPAGHRQRVMRARREESSARSTDTPSNAPIAAHPTVRGCSGSSRRR